MVVLRSMLSYGFRSAEFFLRWTAVGVALFSFQLASAVENTCIPVSRNLNICFVFGSPSSAEDSPDRVYLLSGEDKVLKFQGTVTAISARVEGKSLPDRVDLLPANPPESPTPEVRAIDYNGVLFRSEGSSSEVTWISETGKSITVTPQISAVKSWKIETQQYRNIIYRILIVANSYDLSGQVQAFLLLDKDKNIRGQWQAHRFPPFQLKTPPSHSSYIASPADEAGGKLRVWNASSFTEIDVKSIIDQATKPNSQGVNSSARDRTPKTATGLVGGAVDDEGDTKTKVAIKASTAKFPTPERLAKNLENFIANVQKEIVGQDAAIAFLSDLVKKHYERFTWSGTKPKHKKPSSFFFMGGSGEGKTALGEAATIALFGHPDFGKIIPMGNLITKEDGQRFFGAPEGYIGSDHPGLLEAALLALPYHGKKGGIIILDEASNFGGGDPDVKRQLFMQLYDILERGKFTSSMTGVEYDLTNITFLLTGNDGDTVMRGTTSDAGRVAIHKTMTPKQLKSTLLDSGIPEPLLNRLNGIMMSKPLIRAEVAEIAKTRFLDPIIKEFGRYYPGLKIKYPESLPAQIAEMFFAQGDGARGIKNLIENRIFALLGDAARFHKTGAGNPSSGEIQIAISDSSTGKLAKDIDPFERRVQLTVNYKSDKSSKNFERDVTEDVPWTRLLGLDSAYPLENEVLQSVMRRFRGRLESRLMGQDMLVDAIVNIVQGRYLNPGQKGGAMTLFNIGPTGTGKTESALATAWALFGNERFAEVLSLGNLHSLETLDTFLGRDGVSKKISPFERALKKLANGGILVLDEASNMGGNDRETKAAMFKKFYDILSEGKYHSEFSGVTYDLSNIFFQFTGNDGESLFKGISSDDMRTAIHDENKNRSQVSSILTEAGLPEAVLARFKYLILSKPLTKAQVQKISKVKFLDPMIKKFEENYPTVKVRYDGLFLQQLASSFFSQKEGARSILNFVVSELPASLGMFLGKLKETGVNTKGMTLRLSMTDSFEGKVLLKDRDEKRLVRLKLDYKVAGSSGFRKGQEVDVTATAPQKSLMTETEAKSTAYHESGHALLNNPALTGQKLSFVTILGADGMLGYARYTKLAGHENPTRSRTIYEIARLIAGQMASMMSGHEKEVGWVGDLAHIRGLAKRFLIDQGMEGGLVAVRVDKDGEPILEGHQLDIFAAAYNKMLSEGFELAQLELKKNWALVEAASKFLLQKGELAGEDFEKLRSEYAGKAPVAMPVKQVSMMELIGIESDFQKEAKKKQNELAAASASRLNERRGDRDLQTAALFIRMGKVETALISALSRISEETLPPGIAEYKGSRPERALRMLIQLAKINSEALERLKSLGSYSQNLQTQERASEAGLKIGDQIFRALKSSARTNFCSQISGGASL